MSASPTPFDGDAGLRPALNLADAFMPILSGGDGHRWAWVRREIGQVGLPARAEGPHSPEQKHSNRPVEHFHSVPLKSVERGCNRARAGYRRRFFQTLSSASLSYARGDSECDTTCSAIITRENAA